MHSQQGKPSGWIEVICGPMFSGKTEELIRRLRLCQFAKQRIQIFKPLLDNRYANEYITSHSDQKFLCTPIGHAREIVERIEDATRVVGIDEAQFFSEDVVAVAEKLANRGLRVIVAGLDQDYLGAPFGLIPQLMAIAESVLKLKAICVVCGGLASKSQLVTQEKEKGQILVGSGERYEARCRACFDPEFTLEKARPAVPISKNLQTVS